MKSETEYQIQMRWPNGWWKSCDYYKTKRNALQRMKQIRKDYEGAIYEWQLVRVTTTREVVKEGE